MNALIHWNIICVGIGQRNKMEWGGLPGGRSGRSFFHKFYRNSLHRFIVLLWQRKISVFPTEEIQLNWKLRFMHFWTRQPFKDILRKLILLWRHAASHAQRVGRWNKKEKNKHEGNVFFSFVTCVFHLFSIRFNIALRFTVYGHRRVLLVIFFSLRFWNSEMQKENIF